VATVAVAMVVAMEVAGADTAAAVVATVAVAMVVATKLHARLIYKPLEWAVFVGDGSRSLVPACMSCMHA